MILTIRTDKPEAEIGLHFNSKQTDYIKWQAGRNLSNDIHQKIEKILSGQKAGYNNLTGLILFKGPGSFTGLRIGASVANTLAWELDIPIAGTNGEYWIGDGIRLLQANPSERSVNLDYGSEAKTTSPRK